MVYKGLVVGGGFRRNRAQQGASWLVLVTRFGNLYDELRSP